MKKVFFPVILVSILLLLLLSLSCSNETNSGSIGYEVRFVYDVNDATGQIANETKTVYANDGDRVVTPVVPSVVHVKDSIGEYSKYFTNAWCASSSYTGKYVLIEGPSFTFRSSYYWDTDGSDWNAVYSKALTLFDGTSEQVVLCNTDTVHEIAKALKETEITELDDNIAVGFEIRSTAPISYSDNGKSFTFDSIVLQNEDIDYIIAGLSGIEQDFYTYRSDSIPVYVLYSERFQEPEIDLESFAITTYRDGSYVDSIPLLCLVSSGETSGTYKNSPTEPSSPKQYYNFSDFNGSKNYYYYSINLQIIELLTRDPAFSVVWRPFPVVNFINGVSISQSRVEPNTCALRPEDPSMDGYKFMWWSLNEAGEAFDFNTPITEDTNLYAVFKQLFSVTFVNEGLTSTVQVAYGEYAGALNPTRAGYTLKGWSLTVDGELFDFESTPIKGNTTLYAVWEEV